MRYELRHMDTQSGVGFFAAHPAPNLSYSEMLAHLREHPMDEFMHQTLLRLLGEHRPRKVAKLVDEALEQYAAGDDLLAALLYEAALTHQRLAHLLPRLEHLDAPRLARATPAIPLRSHLQQDQDRHRAWIRLLGANITEHAPLPGLGDAGGPPPVEPAPAPQGPGVADVRDKLETQGLLPPAQARRPMEETIAEASAKLEKAGVFLGPEMAHRASLAPNGLLRHWVLDTRVDNGGLRNALEGMQTAYGRGLSETRARVSYVMETVERCSAYLSFGQNAVRGLDHDCPLVRGSTDAVAAHADPLDLTRMRLEAPYQGQELWWMPAEAAAPDGPREMLVPGQLVSLFCNLDEQQLCSALGSTGLASGNTRAEARLAGLLEALERDAHATIPYHPGRCFRLAADDERIAALLAGYEDCGIHVWFLDLTGEFGVPCYKAVVLGAHGDVNQGTGAGLDARSALVSAMLEVPYPFPGPAGNQPPEGLPQRRLEDLPDHSTGSAEGDLLVLEATLHAHGYEPVYADITRKDMGLPVVRALVPGLELLADFDAYSRVSPRLLRNVLELQE